MAAVLLDVDQWQARIAAHRYDAARWAVNVRGLIEDARAVSVRLIGDAYATYIFTVGEIAEHPGLVDADLVAAFFTEFGRLATNLGDPADDRGVEYALDRAIALQRGSGGDIAGLCLAKAAYLTTRATESRQRLEAIRTAVEASAPGTATWADAIVALAGYEVDVSHYDKAITTIGQLRTAMDGAEYARKFRCAALVYEGVARFTSFQDTARAQQLLTDACAYGDSDDLTVVRWVATAYHYLARISEVDGRYQEAIDLYLVGQTYQDRCPEEIGSNAFLHLRIAEPLIAAGELAAAREHLDEASQLTETGSNRSSIRLQVRLGYATLAAAAGDTPGAATIAAGALADAKQAAFWRGELLCLGYLLVLGIRRRRIDKVFMAALRVLRTAVFGELRRNGLLKLLTRLPVLLPIAIRRMSRPTTRRSGDSRAIRCGCQLHGSTVPREGS
jgi:hypothetical protein